MKPRVFLSHSKHDQDFVKKLAADLRPARIDVWYDDWEIPPGASLRKKIFEDGIPACDLFFVFLTECSASSRWVQLELDAAFVTEMEEEGGFLALFVDSDATRDRLSLDLKSRRIPTIQDTNYQERLLELTSLSWEACARRRAAGVKAACRLRVLELEKDLAEKALQIEGLRSLPENEDSDSLLQLEQITVSLDEKSATLQSVLEVMADKLALGLDNFLVPDCVAQAMNASTMAPEGKDEQTHYYQLHDIVSTCLGKLVVMDIVREADHDSKEWRLTDVGKRIVRKVRAKSAT